MDGSHHLALTDLLQFSPLAADSLGGWHPVAVQQVDKLIVVLQVDKLAVMVSRHLWHCLPDLPLSRIVLLLAAQSPTVLSMVAVQQVDKLTAVLATPDERLVIWDLWLAIQLQKGTATHDITRHL
jgi:hypothetical protein